MCVMPQGVLQPGQDESKFSPLHKPHYLFYFLQEHGAKCIQERTTVSNYDIIKNSLMHVCPERCCNGRKTPPTPSREEPHLQQRHCSQSEHEQTTPMICL